MKKIKTQAFNLYIENDWVGGFVLAAFIIGVIDMIYVLIKIIFWILWLILR